MNCLQDTFMSANWNWWCSIIINKVALPHWKCTYKPWIEAMQSYLSFIRLSVLIGTGIPVLNHKPQALFLTSYIIYKLPSPLSPFLPLKLVIIFKQMFFSSLEKSSSDFLLCDKTAILWSSRYLKESTQAVDTFSASHITASERSQKFSYGRTLYLLCIMVNPALQDCQWLQFKFQAQILGSNMLYQKSATVE